MLPFAFPKNNVDRTISVTIFPNNVVYASGFSKTFFGKVVNTYVLTIFSGRGDDHGRGLRRKLRLQKQSVYNKFPTMFQNTMALKYFATK